AGTERAAKPRASTARAPESGGRPRERARRPTGSGGIGSAQGAQRPSTGRAPGNNMSYYAEKDFFDDPALLEPVQQVLPGNLTLAWYGVETTRVRARPADPARGLTYQDCNLGPYGYDAIPEFLRDRYSMAARGSVLVEKLPDLGYTINRRSDVWADTAAELYEETKAGRWAAAVDIPWAALLAEPRPVRDAAMTQACTLLEEVALVAMEVPGRWVFSINQEFIEQKSFLCAQMIDEARDVEAYRKRRLNSAKGRYCGG